MDIITEAQNLMILPMDELIGDSQTYKMNRKQGAAGKESQK